MNGRHLIAPAIAWGLTCVIVLQILGFLWFPGLVKDLEPFSADHLLRVVMLFIIFSVAYVCELGILKFFFSEVEVGWKWSTSDYMGFRISIGQANCKISDKMHSSEREVCEQLLFKLDNLKRLSFQQLSLFPNEENETREIVGKLAAFSTYAEVLSEEKILFVVQAFYPTWRFPNYFSLKGVGKIFAEAVIINKSGKFETPEDRLLYKYR